MRKIYQQAIAISIAITTLTGIGIWRKSHVPAPASKKTVGQNTGATSAGVSEATLSDIRSSLEKQEYHISFDEQKKMLQSPNRAHNLRAYYEPGKFTVQTRVDTTGQGFKLELTNEGIFADGKPLYTSQSDAKAEHHENKVQISHNAFTEEFINNQEGIRQNFIIENAPEDTRQLQVKMTAKGLKVRQGAANELRFYSETANGQIRNELVYSDLKCWDADKKPLNATLAYLDDRIQISVDAAGAAYPVTIDPIIANGTPQNANKVLEVNQSYMWLGFSVSSAGDVNGDGYSDVIVGAPQYDKGQDNEGAAFVYKGDPSGLTLTAITLECNQANAKMGYSVASAGDFNGDGFSDVLVGMPFYDGVEVDQGRAKLYLGSDKFFTDPISSILLGLVNQEGAYYGISVAAAGDIDGDGFSDVLVSASQASNGQSKEGIVRIFYGNADGTQGSNTPLEFNQANAMFGYSVAPAGDIDADGFSDFIIGARYYTNGQGEDAEGAAFIYRGSAGGIIDSPVIIEGNQYDAGMGNKVSSAGDVNGDGYSDILISAYVYDGPNLKDQGRVYLHLGSQTGINPQPARTFEGGHIDDRMGSSVACAGDVNGDGYSDIMLGAQYYDNGQLNEGAVFVYHGSKDGIVGNWAFMLESNQGDGWFGTAVASAGDVNGDGYSDILVGCYTFDNGQKDEGHVFVYHGGAEGIGTNESVTISGSVSGALIGASVASAGDVNGDGYDDVLIGAPGFDFNGVIGGMAMLCYGSATGIDPGNKVILNKTQADSFFGESVAGAGDINGDGYGDVIIGASDYSNGQSNEGAAFVFYGSSSGINLATGVLLENDIPNSNFGTSVSGAGDINRDGYADIIVGDSQYSSGEEFEGAAIIYYGSMGGPVNKTVIESNLEYTFLGSSVSSAGDVNGDGYGDIIVGADVYSSGEDEEGAAYIFHGSNLGIATNNPKILQGNQPGALMGASVSSAGDVNGDGYSDVVVGAPRYDKNESEEGIVKVYYGTSSGITEVSPAPTVLERNVPNGLFGYVVNDAGDVNGDGYTDLIIGAGDFNGVNANTIKGKAFVYHGSPNGIKTFPSFDIEGNKDGVNLGYAVSGAGDVNGDGYSDIIVGAPHADNGASLDVGSASVFYGNNSKGIRNNVRLLNTDLAGSPINYSQFNQPNFATGLYAKSFIGKNKGKLVWETRGPGIPFSNVGTNPITTSTQFTDFGANYVGVYGTTFLGSIVQKNGISTKVRVRVRYSPVLAITGQMYGPWRYVQSQLAGYNNAPVPEGPMSETVKGKVFTGLADNRTPITVYPNPVSDRLFIKSEGAENIRSIKMLTSGGKLVYQTQAHTSGVDVKNLDAGAYILLVNRQDGSQTSHKVIVKK